MGVKECLAHELINAYPVLKEKEGEFIAQFKGTVVVQPKSTVILCGAKALDKSGLESEKKINNAELAALIASDLWKKDDKKKAEK